MLKPLASPDPLCSLSTLGGWPWWAHQARAFLALWLPVGSGTVGNPREEGERGQDIYSPGSFLGVLPWAGCLLGARGLQLLPGSPSPTAYWVSGFFFFLFRSGGRCGKSGNGSLLLASQSWAILASPCLFLYTLLTHLQRLLLFNSPQIAHLFPARTLRQTLLFHPITRSGARPCRLYFLKHLSPYFYSYSHPNPGHQTFSELG